MPGDPDNLTISEKVENTNRKIEALRIGIFYDGTYLSHVSNYYLYGHERQARLSISGLQEFARMKAAQCEGVDLRLCQIIDSHYFRGRLNARQALEQNTLYRERQFDDVLIREGVTLHFLPVSADQDGETIEKGIDVWFALEAFELAIHKQFDLVVLVSGDGDFVPLVRKLNTLGTRVMLLAWDFEYMCQGKPRTTNTSRSLIKSVNFPIMMGEEINQANMQGSKNERFIDQLFVQYFPESSAGVMKNQNNESMVDPPGKPRKQTGIIKTIHFSKSFGFIIADDGNDEIFFHITALKNCTVMELEPAMCVSFRIFESHKGLDAYDIQRIEGDLPRIKEGAF